MRQKKSRHTASEFRRKDIIGAALACFSEIGFSETNMEDIRQRSGASMGSIYHHFRSKEQLAAEVYIEGIRVYQQELLRCLKACKDPQEAVRALISQHLVWVRDNAEWSSYLFQKRHSVFMDSAEEQIAAMNSEFGRSLMQFFQDHIATGAIKGLPVDIMASVVFGPCMEFTRHYLSGNVRTPIKDAAGLLGDAAWRALGPCRDSPEKAPVRKGKKS